MKSLSEPFIRRPVMTTLVMVALLFSGIMSYYRLPVNDLPSVDYPQIGVWAQLPGASPEAMANTVASPLEKEFMMIPGLEKVTSSNTQGMSNISLKFSMNKKMDAAAQDVESAISRAEMFLPKNMPSRPLYMKANPSDEPIMLLQLTSQTLPAAELYKLGKNVVSQRITMQEGVANVQVYAFPPQMDVKVDPELLAIKQIGLEEIKHIIQANNSHLPPGNLDNGFTALGMNTSGQLEAIEDYKRIILRNHEGNIVRLEDVAEIEVGPESRKNYFRYHGERGDELSLFIAVQRLPGSNTIAVAEAVQNVLPDIQNELPGSAHLTVFMDKSGPIKESIEEVEFTLILALVLVVGIIFLYLGKARDTIIPSLVLPLSLIGTCFIMYWIGFSVNVLSLLAMTLAIGFVVDDAIVVIENIVRHIEEGLEPFEAALVGAKQIGFTVLSMTLSLVASFIPLLFIGGIVGRVFLEFSVTLALAILVSGILSLTLTPMLSARFLHSRGEETLVGRIGNALNEGMLRAYKVLLDKVLHYRKTVLALGLASFLLIPYLFSSLPTDFLPSSDNGYIFSMQVPADGASADAVIKHQKALEKVIMADPAIDSLSSFVWGGSGQLFAKLKPESERDPTAAVAGRLMGQYAQIPGVQAFAFPMPLIQLSFGDGSDTRMRYRVKASTLDELTHYTPAFAEKLKAIPGFKTVSHNIKMASPLLQIEIERDRASLLGVSASDIEMAMNDAFADATVTSIETPEGQHSVTLSVADEFKKGPESLDRFFVKSPLSGEMVPLSSIARWIETVAPKEVHHEDQYPSASISFELEDGFSLSDATVALKKLEKEIFRGNASGALLGAGEAYEETFGHLGFLIMITLLTSYVVLGILYESFVHPITILSSLPLAVIGGLLTLWIFGQALSLYSLVGLILLVGIVKKNGIMMIDHALEVMRSKGMSSFDAIHEACIVRFRPMMMTTFAAIMGAMPIALAIGGSGVSRQGLGLVIVGGLIFSQMLTLCLTPVVFLAFERFRKISS